MKSATQISCSDKRKVHKIQRSVRVTFPQYYISMSTKTHYAAFLIRWQDDGPQSRWRSTVENAHTGEKLYFKSKSDLLRFLWQSLYIDEITAPIDADMPEET